MTVRDSRACRSLALAIAVFVLALPAAAQTAPGPYRSLPPGFRQPSPSLTPAPPVVSGPPEAYSACAWDHVPAKTKAAALAAYHTGMQDALKVLGDNDAATRTAIAPCFKGRTPPVLWMQASVGSQMIQAGAVKELAAASIDRNTLEGAWKDAPDPARLCVRANAARAFGGKEKPCTDQRAPQWFIGRLKLKPASDAAHQALFWFNSRAQSEWADALVDRFVRQPASAAH